MFLFIPIICGTHNWDRPYDSNPKHGSLYCPHCHNNSVSPIKRREFFTVWFVPLVPIHWGKQLRCNICNWRQDFSNDSQLNQMVQGPPPGAANNYANPPPYFKT
ncbi:YBL029C-A [Zygosaccharomyces parabailii]|uniref:ZYBA0S12-01772g1_1 n=1 Tax=Zygosaccharomyces bailii (strain CLIB 213 / ATCC 58445 / CBS 680 / BCRC 21525 / NBRC 1098 / NCYC 1416 / NRRL Y-2227) TaxID=1333698 RepID=A0A8J2TBT2_ZYGB2|nr:YBL029C-A [Zygosaccharomyces parabailii]CDF91562.1 ZYBA0S12-01772g1_1 [Zygosaccharomyces bailii CLIB 213]